MDALIKRSGYDGAIGQGVESGDVGGVTNEREAWLRLWVREREHVDEAVLSAGHDVS